MSASNNRKMDNSQNQSLSFMDSVKEDLKEDINLIKELVDLFQEDVKDLLDDIKNTQDEDYHTTLEKLFDIFNLDTSIFNKTEDIKEDTSYIKRKSDDIKDDLGDMSQNMSSCCSNLNDKSDRNYNEAVSIKSDTQQTKTLVEQLQPTTQSNQSLATVTKLNAIQADLNYIRGLL